MLTIPEENIFEKPVTPIILYCLRGKGKRVLSEINREEKNHSSESTITGDSSISCVIWTVGIECEK
jgi:hypothetical protein